MLSSKLVHMAYTGTVLKAELARTTVRKFNFFNLKMNIVVVIIIVFVSSCYFGN